mgnify:CR=1 FL=1
MTVCRRSSSKMSFSKCSIVSWVSSLPLSEANERHPHQRALEPAHVAANTRREKLVNIIVQFDLQGARFLPQNGKTRLDVRRL